MSQAWLLDLGEGLSVAVGTSELVHLLYAPKLVPVPQTPPHASHVLEWDGRLLPLIDLAHWLRGQPDPQGLAVVGVLACQRSPGAAVEYAGLRLAAPPLRILVADEQACALPAPAEAWEAVALACFDHLGKAVPILDTWRLTGSVLPPR